MPRGEVEQIQTRFLPGFQLLDGFARLVPKTYFPRRKLLNFTNSKGCPWFNVICFLFEFKDQSVIFIQHRSNILAGKILKQDPCDML